MMKIREGISGESGLRIVKAHTTTLLMESFLKQMISIRVMVKTIQETV